MIESVTIDRRFHGPPCSGNGGYSEKVQVTLDHNLVSDEAGIVGNVQGQGV